MKYYTILTVVSAAVATARNVPRQNVDDKEKVCYPDSTGTVAPCQEIYNIEQACQPNGTAPIDYEAHAQCMCKGSYFQDWAGCQKCLLAHGLRSERDNIRYNNIINAASKALCTGTPTAAFPSYFASAESTAPAVTTGNTASSDRFPGKTEVSLYYTPTVSQGPGVITGSAASATHKATPSEDSTSSAASKTNNGKGSSATNSLNDAEGPPPTGTRSSSSSTSIGAAAAPTNQAGVAMIIAGAALMAF